MAPGITLGRKALNQVGDYADTILDVVIDLE
jgi:hypothetical protein